MWGCSSAGRATALQAEGHRFDPVLLHHNYPCVAQPGRAPGLGPGGRMFESCHTDHFKKPLYVAFLISL